MTISLLFSLNKKLLGLQYVFGLSITVEAS